jgi:thioredoxin 1
MQEATTLTRENFDAEVLRSDVPVLVDYWAPRCGPCRQLAPVIEQVVAQRQGALRLALGLGAAEPQAERAA